MNIKEKFIAYYAPYAVKVARATGFPADVLLVHAALETGWGRCVPKNNLFGIKDLPWDEGEFKAETKEVYEARLISIVASFEDFESPLDSMVCYVGLIRTLPRYWRAWQHIERGEVEEYFKALQRAGYATDPQYSEKLIAVWKSLPENWLEIAARAKSRGK